MKIIEVFDRLEELHPHQYGQEALLGWFNACEEEIAAFIKLFDKAYEFKAHTNATEDTMIDEPQVYISYLYAEICAANEEYARYNNQAIIYSNELAKWKTRYIQENRPTNKGYTRNLT